MYTTNLKMTFKINLCFVFGIKLLFYGGIGLILCVMLILNFKNNLSLKFNFSHVTIFSVFIFFTLIIFEIYPVFSMDINDDYINLLNMLLGYIVPLNFISKKTE